MEAEKIDVNDPASWPEDVEKLAEMAEDGVPEDVSADDTAEEAKAKTPEVDAKNESDTPKVDEPKAEKQETEEELPVSTKRGDKTIPYSVLKNAREKANAESAKRQELEERIVELEKTQAQPQTQDTTESPEAIGDLPESVMAKAEKMREDWGDDIADQFLRTAKLEVVLEAKTKELDDVKAQVESRAQNEAATEEQRIQDAIDSNATLAAWQADEESDLFQKAVKLNETLLATDPTYAAKSWDERFAGLTGKVELLYGVTPALEKAQEKPRAMSEDEKQAKVDEALSSVDDTPKSMSDAPGGVKAEITEFEKLEDMSPQELQVHMDKLADDPEKLRAYLGGI